MMAGVEDLIQSASEDEIGVSEDLGTRQKVYGWTHLWY